MNPTASACKNIILLPSSPKLLKTVHEIENHKGGPAQKAIIRFFNSQKPMDGNVIMQAAGISQDGWRSKDGFTVNMQDGLEGLHYYKEQAIARNGISTPAIAVFYGESWHLGAIIYPIRINGIKLEDFPTNWKQLTGNGMWTTDSPNGRIITCPQVSANMRGSSQLLIAEAVLPLSAYLYAANELDLVTAYTRPSAFSSFSGSIEDYVKLVKNGKSPKEEFALNMHQKFGAVFARIDKDGCTDPAAGNYNLVADYTPYVQANLLSLLSKIENVIAVTDVPLGKTLPLGNNCLFCRQIGNNYIYKIAV